MESDERIGGYRRVQAFSPTELRRIGGERRST
jgi:hypothetical protein